MLVSEYRTFIAPLNPSKRTKESFTYAKNRSDFSRSPKKSATQPLLLHTSYPDYIQNSNYYANKERFSHYKNIPAEVRRLRYLAKAKQLPAAYNAASTTFMDLTKPKKALAAAYRLEINPFVDQNYKALAFEHRKTVMTATYLANEIYYDKVYAS